MPSTLKERFARLGRVRGVDRVTSGSPAVLVLQRMLDEPRPIDAVMSLAKRGVSLLKAKRTIEEVIEGRCKVGIELPTVENKLAVVSELNAARIMAFVVRDDEVDVKKLREWWGYSQEQFSLIYNIPLDTLKKWEQGARQPDTAAMNYLRLIQRNSLVDGIYGEEYWDVTGVSRPRNDKGAAFKEWRRKFNEATTSTRDSEYTQLPQQETDKNSA